MAKRLTTVQRKWLLTAHILLAVAWLGTAMSSLALNIVAVTSGDASLLLSAFMSSDILDGFLVRPLAVGATISGIMLAVLSPWGLFRHHWIAAKLIVTTSLIVVGVVLYGLLRASRVLISIVSEAGVQALQNPTFRSNQTLLLIFVVAEVVFLAALVALSVFKPVGRRRQKDTEISIGNSIIIGG